jgi:hypothetical protein
MDIGPGPGGDAPQIFTLDVATGERHQVTRLPPAVGVPSHLLPTCCVVSLDDDTLSFISHANPVVGGEELNPENQLRTFSVKTAVTTTDPDNPTQLHVIPTFAEPGNARSIIEAFQITGPQPTAHIMDVKGSAVNESELDPVTGIPICAPYNTILEAFVLDGERVLQLTNFRRCDTLGSTMSPDRDRIFFYATADPLGTNPCNARNVFSTDRNGGDLRQLTRRIEGEASNPECDQTRTCSIPTVVLNQDYVTRSLVFNSICDLLGTNPNRGDQIFAMRPDGTGLRQLTHVRGAIEESDGTVIVEDVGPWDCAELPTN